MPDPAMWWLFLGASLLLLVTPGPAVLFIVARSVQQGRAAGLVSVAGIHLGTIVHILASAVGVSAILMSPAMAFAIVKYVGAAYLLWMGIRTLATKDLDPTVPVVTAEPLQRAFRDGFLVNILNPKTAIFFLAFLPQFVQPERGPVHWQILALGLAFMALGMLTDGFVAVAAGAAGDFLRRSRTLQRLLRWFSGLSFIGLSVTAALATRR